MQDSFFLATANWLMRMYNPGGEASRRTYNQGGAKERGERKGEDSPKQISIYPSWFRFGFDAPSTQFGSC